MLQQIKNNFKNQPKHLFKMSNVVVRLSKAKA
jgi:hypothetical protein